MTGGSRTARDLAFQTLFELEARPGRTVEEAVQLRVEAWREDERETTPEAVEFATQLVRGALAQREHIDHLIAAAAPLFPVNQLAMTDRVALELGAFDLVYAHSASVAVIINEAVELAKIYGGENSGRFVNGVLGTIAEEPA